MAGQINIQFGFLGNIQKTTKANQNKQDFK